MVDTKTEIMLIHTSFRQQFLSDLSTFAVPTAALALNHFVFQSTPFEWLLAFAWVFWLFLRLMLADRKCHMTPQQAADRLYERHGVVAKVEAE